MSTEPQDAAAEPTPEMAQAQFKELVIDAIVGVGFPTAMIASEIEQTGLAVFTGNQHNPRWEWKRAALEHCAIEALQELYCSMKNYAAADTIGKASMQGRLVVHDGTGIHGHDIPPRGRHAN